MGIDDIFWPERVDLGHVGFFFLVSFSFSFGSITSNAYFSEYAVLVYRACSIVGAKVLKIDMTEVCALTGFKNY